MKTCKRCGLSKPATTEFFNKKLDSFTALCRVCRIMSRRVEYAATKDELNRKRRQARAENPEPYREVDRRRYERDPERRKANARTARLARDEDALKAMHAAYYQRNRERRIAQAVAWGKANPEKRREYARRIYENRKPSAAFRLNHAVGAHIRWSLKGRKKGQKWESLVGFTLNDLIEHLERQFAKGMSWENYGKWQIDHIVPVSAFSYETADDDEFKACWALTNLRPLWRPENIRKRDRRLHLL